MADYINMRVPRKVHKALKAEAQKNGRTIIGEIATKYKVKL